MKKKVGIAIVCLTLIGGGITLLLPRAEAVISVGTEAYEIVELQKQLSQRLQKELGRKIDRIFEKQKELSRNTATIARDLDAIQKKLVRIDRKLDRLETLIE